MRILCVIDSLGPGGAQRQLVGLAISFKKNGNEVSFLTYHPTDFYKSLLDQEQIEVYIVQEGNYVKRAFKMRKLIRRGNYDVVLSFLAAANLICELAGLPFKKWKLVVGERSADPNILVSRKLRTFRWFHIFADFVVANSYKNIELVRNINPLLSDKKCKVIYNMIDTETWKPSLEHIPTEGEKIRIVVAASHMYYKNLNGLIEGIRCLSEREKSKLRIDWYGNNIKPPYLDGSYLHGLSKIQEYGLEDIFNFHEATHFILEKMQNADVVGLFSFFEGLPNVVCEGMALAKVIISSDVSDISLFLSNKNMLFNPNSPSSITESIRYVMSFDKSKLIAEGKKNRLIALQNFSKDQIVASYLNLMRE